MSHPVIEQQVTFLYTHNLSRTAHFYEHMLEFPCVLDQGSCRIYRVAGDSFIGFCQKDDLPAAPKDKDPDRLIFTLVTPAVDAWFGYLTKQGITFEKPPTLNTTYNIYHAFLRDPNGYLIEIQQFLDPAWPKPLNAAD